MSWFRGEKFCTMDALIILAVCALTVSIVQSSLTIKATEATTPGEVSPTPTPEESPSPTPSE